MKKILMVTSFYPPYHIGGADTHVYHLSNALAKKGHKITVLALLDSYFLKTKKKPDLNGYKNHKNVDVIFVKSKLGVISPVISYIFGITANSRIKKIIEGDFDVVHYHNISLFGPKILNYRSKKKLFTIHDHWFICQLNGLYHDGGCRIKNLITKKNLKNQIFHCIPHSLASGRPIQVWRFSDMLKEGLSKIDFFITPSNYMKKRMKASGIDKKIISIPNFITNFSYERSTTKTAKKSYYLFVGRLEENKGVRKLIEIFNNLNETLFIVGDGELAKDLKQIGGSNIKFLGWKSKEELGELYSDAKATIVPSLSPDNFPTVAIESLSFGTPVIGTNIGGIPEIVSLIDDRLIFSPNNFKELMNIINNFNHDQYPKQKIKEIVSENFSEINYLKKYGELL